MILCLTIVCAFSGCYADDRPKVSAATLRKAAWVIVNDCREKVGATEEDVASLKERKIPTTEKGKCTLECLLNTAGTMKNGHFNKEVVVKRGMMMVGGVPDKEAKLKAAVEDCEAEAKKAGDNSCLAAGNLATCFRKHREDAGIKLPTLEELGY